MVDNIPEDIKQQNEWKKKATDNGFVYMEACKGMSGLLQAGSLAQKLLERWLNTKGFQQSKIVPGLWTHAKQLTQFLLIVDDFDVKHVSEQHSKYLIN